tara:strand:+ start:804 stop:1286 length:483 start_codon:yes stop_codon:yes gene_type:complete
MSNNQIKEIERELSLNMREKIVDLQNQLLPLVDNVNIVMQDEHAETLFPLKHTFADGIYVRQMSMNKGSWCIGKIHKHLHVWFLLTGRITVVTEDSKEEYISPCYVKAKPGTKRVIFCNEDCIFVNIHKNPDELRDIEEIEKQIVAVSWEEYEEYIKQKK